jgi:uncharacterized membrane protein
MAASPQAPPGSTTRRRRAYIDWARGLAVLIMIEAHAVDAWTRAADKHSIAYRDATILGGFAAPMFLWLAGLAVVLAAARTAARTGSRRQAADAIVRRGLIIFILAFLFRVQAFIVSPGNHLVTLFRVDILNIMGPAIVAAGLAWAAARTPAARAAVFASLAIVFSMATPIVRLSPAVDRLPLWLQWHLRPAGDMTVFTLLPWAGFVFAGAAAGALLAGARDARAERRIHTALTICGAALILVGFYTAARPSIYASSSFWTSSPTWFAIRVGILMVALSWLYAVEQAAGAREALDSSAPRTWSRALLSSWQAPLERLGQHSLFVYWIHVELVYGYFSWLWWHRLPLWGAVAGYVAFCALMYRAIEWRDRVVDFWRTRPRGRPSFSGVGVRQAPG